MLYSGFFDEEVEKIKNDWYNEELSVYKVAERNKTTRAIVYKMASKLSWGPRQQNETSCGQTTISDDEFIKIWNDPSITIERMSKQTGISDHFLRVRAEALGYKKKPRKERKNTQKYILRSKNASNVVCVGRIKAFSLKTERQFIRGLKGNEKSLLNIGNHECRELVGGYAGKDDPICCGERTKENSSYCEFHHNKNYDNMVYSEQERTWLRRTA